MKPSTGHPLSCLLIIRLIFRSEMLDWRKLSVPSLGVKCGNARDRSSQAPFPTSSAEALVHLCPLVNLSGAFRSRPSRLWLLFHVQAFRRIWEVNSVDQFDSQQRDIRQGFHGAKQTSRFHKAMHHCILTFTMTLYWLLLQ